MQIAVLGSGTIGQSWCALFLAAGHSVVAYDPDPVMEERIIDFVQASRPALKKLAYKFAGSVEQFRFSKVQQKPSKVPSLSKKVLLRKNISNMSCFPRSRLTWILRL